MSRLTGPGTKRVRRRRTPRPSGSERNILES